MRSFSHILPKNGPSMRHILSSFSQRMALVCATLSLSLPTLGIPSTHTEYTSLPTWVYTVSPLYTPGYTPSHRCTHLGIPPVYTPPGYTSRICTTGYNPRCNIPSIASLRVYPGVYTQHSFPEGIPGCKPPILASLKGIPRGKPLILASLRGIPRGKPPYMCLP